MQLDKRSFHSAIGGQLRQAAGREDKPFKIVVSNPENHWSSVEGRCISQADAPAASRIDTWLQSITAFLSMALKQMVADFALSAAALHPEAHCLLNDSISSNRPEMDPQSRRSDKAPEVWQASRHTEEASPKSAGKRNFYLIAPQQQIQPQMRRSAKLATIARLEVVQAGSAPTPAVSVFVRLGASIARARRNRRMAAILEALDNRTLQDLGISRHEIKHVVKNGHPRSR